MLQQGHKLRVLTAFLLGVIVWQLHGVKRELKAEVKLISESVSALNEKAKAIHQEAGKSLAKELVDNFDRYINP